MFRLYYGSSQALLRSFEALFSHAHRHAALFRLYSNYGSFQALFYSDTLTQTRSVCNSSSSARAGPTHRPASGEGNTSAMSSGRVSAGAQAMTLEACREVFFFLKDCISRVPRCGATLLLSKNRGKVKVKLLVNAARYNTLQHKTPADGVHTHTHTHAHTYIYMLNNTGLGERNYTRKRGCPAPLYASSRSSSC